MVQIKRHSLPDNPLTLLIDANKLMRLLSVISGTADGGLGGGGGGAAFLINMFGGGGGGGGPRFGAPGGGGSGL